MKKHFSITVKGRVQGVFFRASATDTAKSLGLKGFVRNERDGSVYIEAEGEEPGLADFVAWCKKGPPGAQVLDVAVTEGAFTGFSDFTIKRF